MQRYRRRVYKSGADGTAYGVGQGAGTGVGHAAGQVGEGADDGDQGVGQVLQGAGEGAQDGHGYLAPALLLAESVPVDRALLPAMVDE